MPVPYRPDEQPVNGVYPCNNCSTVMTELKPQMRSKHVHNCRQRELRDTRSQQHSLYSRRLRNRKLPFAEYCYACCKWSCSEDDWGNHCKWHLENLTMRCGLLTFRYRSEARIKRQTILYVARYHKLRALFGTTLLAPFNDSAPVHDCDRLSFALELNSLLYLAACLIPIVRLCRQLASALAVLFAFNLRRGSHHDELIDQCTKMRPTSEALLGRWHRMLGLLRQSPPWYRDRLLEEVQGRRTANTPWQKRIMTAYRAAGLLTTGRVQTALCDLGTCKCFSFGSPVRTAG